MTGVTLEIDGGKPGVVNGVSYVSILNIKMGETPEVSNQSSLYEIV